MLRRLEARFAGIDVAISVEATRQPVKALLAGELDLGILSAPPRRGGHCVAPLFRGELVVLMSAAQPLASRVTVRAADFAGEHLFTYAVPTHELELFRRVLEPGRVRPRRVTQVELTEAMIELVRAGLGLTVLARWALPQDMRQLRAVSLSPKLDRRWYGVWSTAKTSQASHGSTMAAPARAMSDVFRVTTVSPRTMAVAAMSESITRSGEPAFSVYARILPHSVAVASSTATIRSTDSARTLSSQVRKSRFLRPSANRSMPLSSSPSVSTLR